MHLQSSKCASVAKAMVLGGDSTTVNKTLERNYRKRLGSDSNPGYYDDKLEAFASSYLLPTKSNLIVETSNYLRSLTDNDGNVYSGSLRQYSKLKENIKGFSMPQHSNFYWCGHYQAAKSLLAEKFKGKLTPLKYVNNESIIENIPKLSTHAGFTYLLTGNSKKGDNLDNIFERYSKFEEVALSTGRVRVPMMVGCRTQVSGAYDTQGNKTFTCKHKSRAVLMVDLMSIIFELQFQKPLQSVFNEWQSYAGGKSDSRISELVRNNVGRGSEWLSIDYSKYDQTISDWLIRDAFDVLKSWFKDGSVNDDYWNPMVDAFINKTIMDADGDIFVSKGVPSGSMFTQIIDTVVNALMITTYAIKMGFSKREGFSMLIMGDDNLVVIPKGEKEVDLEHLASYLQHNFGITTNGSKSSKGTCLRDDPEFLSRVWTVSGPAREVHTIIAKMLYPERYRNYHAKDGAVVEEVFYSYFLSYSRTMRENFDIQRFLQDYPQFAHATEARKYEVVSHWSTGYLNYNYNYVMKYTSA